MEPTPTTITTMDPLAALSSLSLLRPVPPSALAPLAPDTDLVRLPAGEVIERRGTRGRQLVGIVEGIVSAVTSGGHELALGPGDQLGAREVVDDAVHTVTYVAQTPVVLVVVFGPAFRALARSMPELAVAVRAERTAVMSDRALALVA